MKGNRILFWVFVFILTLVATLANLSNMSVEAQYVGGPPAFADFASLQLEPDDSMPDFEPNFHSLVYSEANNAFYGIAASYDSNHFFVSDYVAKLNISDHTITMLTEFDGYFRDSAEISSDGKSLFVLLQPEYASPKTSIAKVNLDSGAITYVFQSDETIDDFVLTTDKQALVSYNVRLDLIDLSASTVIDTIPAESIAEAYWPRINELKKYRGTKQTIAAIIPALSDNAMHGENTVFLSLSPEITKTHIITGYADVVATTSTHTVIQTEKDWEWVRNGTAIVDHSISRNSKYPFPGFYNSHVAGTNDSELILKHEDPNNPYYISFETISLSDPTVTELFDLDLTIGSLHRIEDGKWFNARASDSKYSVLHPIVSTISLPIIQERYCSSMIDDSFSIQGPWPTDGDRVYWNVDRRYTFNLPPDSSASPISPHPVLPDSIIRVKGSQSISFGNDSLWGIAFAAENGDVYFFVRNVFLGRVFVIYSPTNGSSEVLVDRSLLGEQNGSSEEAVFSAEIYRNNQLKLIYDDIDIGTFNTRSPIVASAPTVWTFDSGVNVKFDTFQQTSLGCKDQLTRLLFRSSE